MKKKILAGILAGAMTFCSFGNFEVEAATRSEIAAVQVKKSGNFKYWNKDAAAINALKDYRKCAVKAPCFNCGDETAQVLDL